MNATAKVQYIMKPSRLEEYPSGSTKEIAGGAAAARRLKAELAKRGWLDTAAGTGGDRYSVRRTVGRGADRKGHREQVIAVRAAALD